VEITLAMLRIAHRGNVSGKNEVFENYPIYVKHALDRGFDAEIDVWLRDSCLYLGHDCPVYPIEFEFLKQTGLWVHAKNKELLPLLMANNNINWFWHENDTYTLTSFGFVWTYPGNLIEGCIVNQPDKHSKFWDKQDVYQGVCADDFSNIKI